MGLKSGETELEEFNEAWSSAFRQERTRLIAALGPLALSVEHVGSTAIPELCAKPIIDIAVAVPNLELGEGAITLLEDLGYEYKGEAGIPGRHFFALGPPDNRTHYVHVEPLNGPLWRNHILFRDYLRDHPDEVQTYAQLKHRLAEQFRHDRPEYARGKDEYIAHVVEAAERCYELDESGRSRRVAHGPKR